MCWDVSRRHAVEKSPEENDGGLPTIIMEK